MIAAQGYSFPASETLSASMLRCLAVILDECQRHGRVTWARIVSRLKLRSNNAIMQAMTRLKALGLVSWENYRGGTIRPRCYMRLERSAVNRGDATAGREER